MRDRYGTLAAAQGSRVACGKAVDEKFQWVSGMTCSEFEQVVIETSRGTVADAGAMAHAETCARCRESLENEQALNAALRTLQVEDQALGAGTETEGALVAEFRKRHPAVSRRWRKPAAIGAIAAGMVLAMAVSSSQTAS